MTARTRVLAALGAGLLLLSTAWAARPSLPDQIPVAERLRLQEVAERASVVTRVGAEPFAARRDLFEYLLDHPEFATHVTRTLRVARYRIWRTADGLSLDDGWGSTGNFWLIHGAPGRRVMYARGEYRQRLLPDIHGEAVVMIEYDFGRAPDGREVVTASVTGFVKLDSRLVRLATRLASGIASRKADLEAHRLLKVFAKVSRALDGGPASVYEQLRQRPDVPRRELEEFRQLLNIQ